MSLLIIFIDLSWPLVTFFDRLCWPLLTSGVDYYPLTSTEQFEAMTDELERRREECLQLRAMMAEHSITTHEIAKQSYGGIDSIVNEDNELATAYRTQKELNRLELSALCCQIFTFIIRVISLDCNSNVILHICRLTTEELPPFILIVQGRFCFVLVVELSPLMVMQSLFDVICWIATEEWSPFTFK